MERRILEAKKAINLIETLCSEHEVAIWALRPSLQSARTALGLESLTVPNSDTNLSSGHTIDLLDPDSYRSIAAMTIHLQNLMNSLSAMMGASEYSPTDIMLAGRLMPVHNRTIAGLLQENYTLDKFQSLFANASAKGVFECTTDTLNWPNRSHDCAPELSDMLSAAVKAGSFEAICQAVPDNATYVLAFISASPARLSETLAEDVSLHFRLLQFLEEELVRKHGMVRHKPIERRDGDGVSERSFDKYLADNFWLIPALRLQFPPTSLEAEWAFISVMAEGYCMQVNKILSSVPTKRLSDQLQTLLRQGHAKANEYINRSYARITDSKPDGGSYRKSDGGACPSWAIPGTYEYVTSMAMPTRQSPVPGANTPFVPGQASLYAASKAFLANLEMLVEIAPQWPSVSHSSPIIQVHTPLQ